jgi:hypothetical protein
MHRFVVTGTVAALCVVMGVNAYAKNATPAPAPALPKDLAPSAVAGVYTRDVDGQPGTLIVKPAGPHNIDVKLDAAVDSGVRKGKGAANSVLKLVKNVAVLTKKGKGCDYSVSIRFMGNIAVLLYNGQGFGGAGVDPTGVYRRTTQQR